jgi:hypothetical protein
MQVRGTGAAHVLTNVTRYGNCQLAPIKCMTQFAPVATNAGQRAAANMRPVTGRSLDGCNQVHVFLMAGIADLCKFL